MLDRDAIRSASNPLLQRVRAVRSGKERGVLLLEGGHLVDEALRQGMAPEVVLVSERHTARLTELAARGVPVRGVTEGLLASVSGLRTTPGELALVAAPPRRAWAELGGLRDALVVVVAGVQDPGNLGALARTAEATGAACLVRLPGTCSPWNEKALRGSTGSLLRLPVLEAGTDEEALRALDELGFRHVVAATRGGEVPERIDWSGSIALWVSSETGALPANVAPRLADCERVTIPMVGEVESLNVTAAAAVLLYAARREESAR